MDEKSDLVQEAQHPGTKAARLSTLAASHEPHIQKAVVQNPNTPIEVLYQLGRKHPREFLKNPLLALLFLEDPQFWRTLPRELAASLLDLEDLSKEILNALAHHLEGSILIRVAQHPNADEELLRTLSLHNDWQVRRAIAWNLSASSEILRSLAESIEPVVRREVAGNPNTPQEVLTTLSDGETGVRIEVAANPKTPPEVLRRLSHEKDEWIIKNLLKNPSTPTDVLALLSLDEAPEL